MPCQLTPVFTNRNELYPTRLQQSYGQTPNPDQRKLHTSVPKYLETA